MTKETLFVEGVVAFSNLKEHEFYEGKSTGRYSLVVTLSDAEASKLSDRGVKVKQYDGKNQRKFASQYNVGVIDAENAPVSTEIPYGSKVRVLFTTGNPHPVHGTPTYLDKVRVIEMAEGATTVPEEF